jgi:hypothetical protein
MGAFELPIQGFFFFMCYKQEVETQYFFVKKIEL